MQIKQQVPNDANNIIDLYESTKFTSFLTLIHIIQTAVPFLSYFPMINLHYFSLGPEEQNGGLDREW